MYYVISCNKTIEEYLKKFFINQCLKQKIICIYNVITLIGNTYISSEYLWIKIKFLGGNRVSKHTFFDELQIFNLSVHYATCIFLNGITYF